MRRNPADRAKPKMTSSEKSAKRDKLSVWDFDELDAFLDSVADDDLSGVLGGACMPGPDYDAARELRSSLATSTSKLRR